MRKEFPHLTATSSEFERLQRHLHRFILPRAARLYFDPAAAADDRAIRVAAGTDTPRTKTTAPSNGAPPRRPAKPQAAALPQAANSGKSDRSKPPAVARKDRLGSEAGLGTYCQFYHGWGKPPSRNMWCFGQVECNYKKGGGRNVKPLVGDSVTVPKDGLRRWDMYDEQTHAPAGKLVTKCLTRTYDLDDADAAAKYHANLRRLQRSSKCRSVAEFNHSLQRDAAQTHPEYLA